MSMIPDLSAVKDYLGPDQSWTDLAIQNALTAQAGDQAKKCKIPTMVGDPTWMPDALAEARCRRVQVALSLQPLPLGVQVTISDYNAATTRLGSPSKDPLVADLERPFRKIVIG